MLEKNSIKKIYQETIRISNLYYSNCSVQEMLNCISYITGLPAILIDDCFHIVSVSLNVRQSFINHDPSDLQDICILSRIPDADSRITVKLVNDIVSFQVLPLPNQSHSLCLESTAPQEDSSLQSLIHNCLIFLALTIDREDVFSLNYYANGHFEPFFRLLYGDTPSSPGEIRNICSIYGFQPDLKRVCITVQFSKDDSPLKIQRVLDFFHGYLRDTRTFLISQSDYISIFCFYPASTLDLDAVTQSYALSNDLSRILDEKFDSHPSIGISNAHCGPETIRDTFEESFRVITVQHQLNISSVSSYFEQSIYHILNMPELSGFRIMAGKILHPLITSDRENATHYLETLEAYFYNSFNIKDTAKSLYIHRNTLTYRLQQIKELLKYDFNFQHNTNALFSLYLCICVYRLGYHPEQY